jgi:hypothetical protein
MIGIGFIHFRTCELAHLDAAWFTLSKQDFTDVGHVVFLDNNTAHDPEDIVRVLDRYPIPVPRILCFSKHGLNTRTQSWSVNEVCRLVQAEWVFITRTDFLLNYDCLRRFRLKRDNREDSWRGFVTSYCHQMGYDAALSNTDALAPHSFPDAPWRTDPHGPAILVGKEPAHYFHSTDKDAGVWLTRRSMVFEAGGLNEQMVSWGFQQQAFQRALRHKTGAEIVNVPEYLFHHQHHYAVRDFNQAHAELRYDTL